MKANKRFASVLIRFSASASTYEENARFQKKVAQELIKHIPHDSDSDFLLEIGCGTGLLTRLLYEHFPKSQIYALDQSPSMIAENQTQFSSPVNLSWHVADICNFKSLIQFPLVVSNCALHWLESLEEGFQNIYNLTQPRGKLVISIMIDGTLTELHETRKKIAPHKIPLGRLPQTNEVLNSLKKTHFNIHQAEEKVYTMYYSSARSFLRILHDTGVTGGSISQAHQSLNRTELNRLMESYETTYHSDGQGVRATYHTLFVVAEKEALN
jgi:malonyl-CoA O-methyltransferase